MNIHIRLKCMCGASFELGNGFVYNQQNRPRCQNCGTAVPDTLGALLSRTVEAYGERDLAVETADQFEALSISISS